MNKVSSAAIWIKANWFFLVAASLVATDATIMQLRIGAPPRLLEYALLADFCIVLPGIYLSCYWRKGKRSVLRALALASLGFWASSHLLPASGQFIIPELWPVRYLALAALLLIEVKIIVAFYRSVFSGASPQDAAKRLQNESGMPAWAAKLAAAEAALWGKVYNMVKALLSSRRR